MNYEYTFSQVVQVNKYRAQRAAKGYCLHCNQYHSNLPAAIATMCFAVKAITYDSEGRVTGIEYISEDEQLRFFVGGEATT